MTVSLPYAERQLASVFASTAPLTRLADVLLWVDEVEDGHWSWGQAHRETDTYAVVNIGGRTEPVHRYLYEALVEPVPDGMELDHACRWRPCCYPGHLEPVTHAENMRRMSVARVWCIRGHRYDDPWNTYVDPNGWRRCRACRDEGYPPLIGAVLNLSQIGA